MLPNPNPNPNLTGMRMCSLRNCSTLRSPAVAAIGEHCALLEELIVSECCMLDDMALTGSSWRQLRVLEMNGLTRITDGCIESLLLRCHYLHTLDVGSCSFEGNRLAAVIASRPMRAAGLEALNLSYLPGMDDDGLRAICLHPTTGLHSLAGGGGGDGG